MRNLNLNIIVLLLVVSFFTACMSPFDYRVKGNGNVVEQERTFDMDFDVIELEEDYTVYIKEGENSELSIRTDDNLLDFIQTKNQGGKLTLKTTRGYNLRGTQGIVIYIETPDVDRINLSGSGRIETEEIHANDMAIRISGSGEVYSTVQANSLDVNITGSGKIDLTTIATSGEFDITGSGDIIVRGDMHNSDINISGSGDVRAYGLEQKVCNVKITGSGDISVDVEEELYVKITGSGNVNYIGYPSVSTNITGSGDVNSNN